MTRDSCTTAGRSFFLVLVLMATSGRLSAADTSVVTVQQFYRLANDEARLGAKVRIEGIVLFSDPDFGMLWIQDETGRLFLPINNEQSVPAARSTAVVTGKTALVDGAPKIVDFKIRRTGKTELPPPKMLTPLNIQGRKQETSRVVGAGTVIRARMKDDTHVQLVIAFLRRYQFRATISNCSRKDLDGLLGSHVELTGCATQFSNVNHPELAAMQMFVPDMSDVVVFQRGPASVFDAPQISLADAGHEFRSRRDPRLVRIAGMVESQPEDGMIVLQDGDARLNVRLREDLDLAAGSRVEVAGIVWKDEDDDRLLVDHASVRHALTSTADDTGTDESLPVLRSVQSVRSLTPEMAASKYPVEIRGVVTYYDPVWRVLFVSDETGGIYVDEKSQALPIHLGDRVVVRGESDPGGFSSMVMASRVQRIGDGRLPDPRLVPAARVLSGAEDSQWLTLTATVESVERSQKNLVLNLRGIQENFPFQAVLCSGARHHKRKNWVGSEIKFHGVCGTRANANRQAVGVYVHIPGIEHVEFLNQASEDPFAIPRMAISDLFKFNPEAAESVRQVRISGVVTYSGSSGEVAVQDDGQGILLRLQQDDQPQPGDQIDVIGYPILNSQQRLQATQWRRTGRVELPTARSISVDEILDQSFDAQFVLLDALVLRNNADSVTPGLSLQSGGVVFSADLSSAEQDGRWAMLPAGSVIRVEGVLDVIDDGWGTVQSFRLLCPGTANVAVIRAAPWWNATRVGLLVAGLAFLVVTGVMWGFTLRRSIKQQRAQIENEHFVRSRLTERYNRLVDNAGELIFSIRRDGAFVTANPATARVLQSTVSRLTDCEISSYLTTQSVQLLHDCVSRLSVEHIRGEVELKTRNSVVLEAAIYLQAGNSGEEQIQCIARDVSERRRLENQMRHMQKMESIGQLVAGIAHDYNNLMTVVLCNSEILLGHGELEHSAAESVSQIRGAAERAASLTQQLLAFSRRQIMSMTVFRPSELLASLASMLQRLIGESIPLECDLGENVPCIRADRGMLEQVIVNMAVNARDAMPNGGRLRFTLRHRIVEPDSASPPVNPEPGEYVQISVEDTGCGIHPDNISSIFEPFYTTKEVGKGTGLGLSTAFGIIRQHKGWIDVESALQAGTTFIILLPVSVAEESIPHNGSQYPAETELTGQETILVVEDDLNVRRAVTQLLSLSGYEVIEAGSGREALSTWQQFRDRIEVVITDMIMSDGMSGYEMAQQLKAVSPETRFIYCSGYSQELARLSTLDPTERLLAKPFENQALLQLVRELLEFNVILKA
ncbi:MAG: ATP-binding protein [Planctomycetaceae bacterium]|nr:ATP-binding protein [Planctomycetaceae bacterium]